MIDIKFIIDIVYDILIKMTLWVLIGGIPIVFMALIVVIVKKKQILELKQGKLLQ